ncbi:hypothetical protein SVIOM74S_06246 [Streptomyces violarus]
MTRPLIGVSTYLESGARWGVWELEAALLPAGYPRLVQRAGGLAAMLPPDDPAHAAAAVARLERAGAGHRGRAGCGARTVRRRAASPHRAAGAGAGRVGAGPDRRGTDGGCAAAGHLPGYAAAERRARGDAGAAPFDGHAEVVGVFGNHAVKPVPGSLYAGVVPRRRPRCRRTTTQAVDRLGTGLVPSAYADDGTVEALELPSGEGWVLGVQWHPEIGEDVRACGRWWRRQRRPEPVLAPLPGGSAPWTPGLCHPPPEIGRPLQPVRRLRTRPFRPKRGLGARPQRVKGRSPWG